MPGPTVILWRVRWLAVSRFASLWHSKYFARHEDAAAHAQLTGGTLREAGDVEKFIGPLSECGAHIVEGA